MDLTIFHNCKTRSRGVAIIVTKDSSEHGFAKDLAFGWNMLRRVKNLVVETLVRSVVIVIMNILIHNIFDL